MKSFKVLAVASLAAALFIPSSIPANAAPVEPTQRTIVTIPKAFSTVGAIHSAWVASGGANGVLGAPTGNEVGGLKNGGVYQQFRGGAIIWSPATGAKLSTNGDIRNAWRQNNSENGVLGYPTSNIVRGLKNGGMYQQYQGGAILWTPATGAKLSTNGEIRNLWASTGFENGGLGYPTSNIVRGLKNGGMYQNYQGGAIIYSPATGAKISIGAIREIWAATGFENGRLGYPTTNEFKISNGIQQSYQGGTITYIGGRAIVTYIDHSPTASKAYAKSYLSQRGFGSTGNTCLVKLWERESNWKFQIANPYSGAYGIPQSLPGNKMASIAPDWATNSRTQIQWGVGYIMERYKTPCAALKHSDVKGWY